MYSQIIRDLISRFTARSFVVTVVVLWFIATHPDVTVEQIVGLLTATGFLVGRSIAEDRVTTYVEAPEAE